MTVLGRCDDERKHAALARADVLCAPSLGGESFGMVLTEAFAAGTPVIASDIAGYRDVVRNGVDGILHQRGNATELAEALQELYYEPERRLEMAAAARQRAERFAWPRVAAEVLEAYEDAQAMPQPEGTLRRFGARHGLVPADGKRVRPKRLPRLETDPTAARPAVAAARTHRHGRARRARRRPRRAWRSSASGCTGSSSRCCSPARPGCWPASG